MTELVALLVQEPLEYLGNKVKIYLALLKTAILTIANVLRQPEGIKLEGYL